jgi:ABC-type ATPase involved in cell division
LRIAVVVALLRIGHRHGIATHPGLLLIDSPRAEEVQDHDAVALLAALERLCIETPGLQILVTTADEDLVHRALTESTVIAPPGPGQPLW